jgi:hypothetical protein
VRNLLCAALVSVVGVAATVTGQDVSKSKTKISVDDGKDMKVTGCVARAEDGAFSLTHAAGKDGPIGSYLLVADGDEKDALGKHVGHRVEIKGKAADRGDGEVTIKSKSEVRNSEGDKKKRESATTVKGDLHGLPFLGVKSVRMLATVCP